MYRTAAYTLETTSVWDSEAYIAGRGVATATAGEEGTGQVIKGFL